MTGKRAKVVWVEFTWRDGWAANVITPRAGGYADRCLTPWGAVFAAWRAAR